MGPKSLEIFDNSPLTEAQKQQPAAVWTYFTEYFEPKSNFRLSRFQLRKMRQSPDEPIDNYITRLRSQAQKCQFENNNVTNDYLLDQVIVGIRHTNIRRQLLSQDPKTLTIDKAVELVR
jgi:hypothetical protein